MGIFAPVLVEDLKSPPVYALYNIPILIQVLLVFGPVVVIALKQELETGRICLIVWFEGVINLLVVSGPLFIQQFKGSRIRDLFRSY